MLLALGAWGCAAAAPEPSTPEPGEAEAMQPPGVSAVADGATSTPAPTLADAEAFMANVERELRDHLARREQAAWVQANFITEDTQAIAADAARATMSYLARTIREATRFAALELPADLARKFRLLRLAGTVPVPARAADARELAAAMARMEAGYARARVCPRPGGRLGPELARVVNRRGISDRLRCRARVGGVTALDLDHVMASSRDERALREAWLGWHDTADVARGDYLRFVSLGNEGAREIGFDDVGQMWRSAYDMPPDAFEVEVERIWQQVEPLYRSLHCYVRTKIRQRYGPQLVPADGAIPAHLLGNMWAQSWENIHPLVEPYPQEGAVDLTQRLAERNFDPVRMVRLGERFFTSLGLERLPDTFWQRSLFAKPVGRDVECHASAWDVSFAGDLRIKMCISVHEHDFRVIHHELGHNYYQRYTLGLPILFQTSANDGLHEALGDTIGLSVNASYLHRIGLLRRAPTGERARLNRMMRVALEKVAFLPFGRAVDQWRWDTFAERVGPERYNAHWWELRRRYQGIAPPEPRDEARFDPAAKYHVAASVPYVRYFLALVYQFQLHRALCRAIGQSESLAECTIYGNQEAGRRLRTLMEKGASQPWQQTLYEVSGERQADGQALLEYFAPLQAWLREQTKADACGW